MEPMPTENEAVKTSLAAVYESGFNIYAAINKLKKKMNRKDHFPDEVLIAVCDSYWNNKPGIKKRWPWFIQAMVTETNLWSCAQHEKAKPDPRAPMAQSIKDILRNI